MWAGKGDDFLLTEKQYYALCKYRDNFIPVASKLDDMTKDLFEHRYIKPKKVEYSKEEGGCIVYYQKRFWELTQVGCDELADYEIIEKQNRHQRRIELISTAIGIMSAVATVVGAVFAVLAFFS